MEHLLIFYRPYLSVLKIALECFFEQVSEKLASFHPTEMRFEYLVSFTDNTHYENSDLSKLQDIFSSGRSTDKIILTWQIKHILHEKDNDLQVTIRIANPINPLLILQAALSKTPEDIDNLDFSNGSVSVSVNGATQITSEEFFELVTRWTKSCPKPVSITSINDFFNSYKHLFQIINYWIFPIIYSIIAFSYLIKMTNQTAVPYAFIFIVGFMMIRKIASNINNRIDHWERYSTKFSLFMLTGGDSNQATRFAALSKNSSIKLFTTHLISFLLNISAGYLLSLYILN